MESPIEEVEAKIPEEPIAKKNYVMIIILVFVLTVPVIPFLLYKYGIEAAIPISKPVTIEISSGSGVSKIADELLDAGLIDSPLLFKLYVKLNHLDKNLQAGTYEFNSPVSIIDIANKLQTGLDDVTVTFIEGWNAEQFALEASKSLEKVDYNDFMGEVRKNNYEGYLFPDTYFLSKDTTTDDLISRLRNTFDEKTKDLLTASNLNKAGLTREQAIIFASIVEREVSNESDRPVVAGILINRWLRGERLDADATTQYSITHKSADPYLPILEEVDWWPHDIPLVELNYDSPYNTRFNSGLPPTPISSISLSALNAVLNYTDTNYSFYLTDSDGVTHFSTTLEEHERNASKYLY